MNRQSTLIFAIIASLAAIGNTAIVIGDESVDFFETRIRPLLVERCYDCHGPESAEGKLRLDSKPGWQRGGESGPVIVPGDPAASLLIRAVQYKDDRLKMPPKDGGGKLSDVEIADLTTWIRRGAVDPRKGKATPRPIDAEATKHWAFQPIARPSVPDSVHPIDYFIDKELLDVDFESTPPADTRILIRRLTFDLIGLPPTTEQLKTTRDQIPQLVDELLDSPRHGERWARHWLDVARYSDAKDGVLMYGDARIRPFAYTYRDYVIRAFNSDKPFDQFIREQLAADQLPLPKDSPDLAAMGLLTLGRMFDRNRHDVIDDQIDVVTRGFLGLTTSCARCHDHKFDPIPTADYYSLYGVFASSEEPYERPRIEPITEAGKAYEEEFGKKLKEVYALREQRYSETLHTARDRTADYLVKVVTTEPDISETSVFFLSLIEEQLRPQITYRWRKLIARRAFADDPIFGPWHDLMRDFQLRPDEWQQRGVDSRVIDALVQASPKTREEVARSYGRVIRDLWGRESDAEARIAEIDNQIAALSGPILLADIVGGGDGFGTGKKGLGIHPVTGKPTTGDTGFIEIPRPDELVTVPDNRFVDGVFVPKSGASTISSTGLRFEGLPVTGGKTWDYFKFGPSSGSTTNQIDGIDFNQVPQSIVAMHANKGITFDLQEMRKSHDFRKGRFTTRFGHGGAKDESRLDFTVLLDGKAVLEVREFLAQQKGEQVDIPLPETARFLTLIVTEGGQGISHDQAILGNPSIVPDADEKPNDAKLAKLVALMDEKIQLEQVLDTVKPLAGDPLAELLLSDDSPVWFPENEVYYYLSRQKKDAFRGLVGQLDSISVKHKSAAGRAMVVVDANNLCDPVIFQRGDASQPGAPVRRQFLRILAGEARVPFSKGSGRLELADQIAAKDNPLTARVWVNRVWMHHFGEPLVETPSDFGLRTAQPVHHELLDYLASELIENGWHTKPIHRLITSSSVYQRSSLLGDSRRLAAQYEGDPNNRYFWRANRRRLDLEQMRDTLLVVSGNVDFSMYGRPPLITAVGNRRRTVYSFVERQSVPNVVKTFDFANADTSTARRVATTVPQQALFAMNSEFVSATAGAVAVRVTAADGPLRDRIDQMYEIVLGRRPSSDEIELGEQFLTGSPDSEPDSERALLEQYIQTLLMTNEFMFVD